MDLRLVRSELRQDTPETKRILAEGRAHPVLAGGGRVAFVEDEADDLQHGRQTGGKIRSARDLEGNARLAEGSLGPNDALGDRGLWDQKGARDLIRSQAAEQAQSERNARLGWENRMAGYEHEAQEVVAEVIVEDGVEIRHRHLLLGPEFATKLFVLALKSLGSAQEIDRTMFRGGRKPCSRVIGDAGLRPLLKRGNKSILCEFLGQTHIAHDPRDTGYDL